MHLQLSINHILDVVGLRVESVLIITREVLVTAFEHVSNVDVIFIVLGVISLVPLNPLLLLRVNRIFVSVMVLLSRV